MLEQFKRTHLSAALVFDECGDVAGVVSFTDVISSIVGEEHYHTLGGLAMLVIGQVPRMGDVFHRGADLAVHQRVAWALRATGSRLR